MADAPFELQKASLGPARCKPRILYGTAKESTREISLTCCWMSVDARYYALSLRFRTEHRDKTYFIRAVSPWLILDQAEFRFVLFLMLRWQAPHRALTKSTQSTWTLGSHTFTPTLVEYLGSYLFVVLTNDESVRSQHPPPIPLDSLCTVTDCIFLESGRRCVHGTRGLRMFLAGHRVEHMHKHPLSCRLTGRSASSSPALR